MEEKRSGLRDPKEWNRDVPGRKIAGVCASIAVNMGVSVSVVRTVFLILAVFHGFGILLYGIMWMLMPPGPNTPSAIDEVIESVRRILTGASHKPNRAEREVEEREDRTV
jgi:phage shock protein PspC (stress-responsive transcriptional regulator)